jgi:hypothetical protein
MFLSTEASTSQWESSVFVSPIKAPALMILDEYAADRSCFSGSVLLDGMVLGYRLPELDFQSLSMLSIIPAMGGLMDAAPPLVRHASQRSAQGEQPHTLERAFMRFGWQRSLPQRISVYLLAFRDW